MESTRAVWYELRQIRRAHLEGKSGRRGFRIWQILNRDTGTGRWGGEPCQPGRPKVAT